MNAGQLRKAHKLLEKQHNKVVAERDLLRSRYASVKLALAGYHKALSAAREELRLVQSNRHRQNIGFVNRAIWAAKRISEGFRKKPKTGIRAPRETVQQVCKRVGVEFK